MPYLKADLEYSCASDVPEGARTPRAWPLLTRSYSRAHYRRDPYWTAVRFTTRAPGPLRSGRLVSGLLRFDVLPDNRRSRTPPNEQRDQHDAGQYGAPTGSGEAEESEALADGGVPQYRAVRERPRPHNAKAQRGSPDALPQKRDDGWCRDCGNDR